MIGTLDQPLSLLGEEVRGHGGKWAATSKACRTAGRQNSNFCTIG